MDEAHKETDELLEKLERRIDKEYDTAYLEMREKAKKYLEKFDKQDAKMLEKLKAEKITEKEYLQWRANNMMTGRQYQEMRDTLAMDCLNANEKAMNMVYGSMKDAYVINRNYGAFEVEQGSQMDTSFTLYDRDTVERLIRDDPDILPKPRVDIPKDLKWNRQKINSALLQGILQGESIPNIAKRLRGVANMNKSAAVRNARTMTTAAECAGRIDSYKRAQDMGINMEQVWLATLDGRTRHSHRQLDGQKRKVGEKFDNGCRYPADPEGPAHEVYNCRCTIMAQVEGVDLNVSDLVTRNHKLGGMSYKEWKASKAVAKKKKRRATNGVQRETDRQVRRGKRGTGASNRKGT